MKKKLIISLLLFFLSSMSAFAQTPSAPQTELKIGDKAPDFTLTNTEGKS